MKKKTSERRQVENEVYFRGKNKEVQEGFDEINKVAEEQGDDAFVLDSTMKMYFYCECFDENCKERIRVSLDTYNSMHENNKLFVIIAGHDDKNIERVVDKKANYWVVEKKQEPPKTIKKLKSTDKSNV